MLDFEDCRALDVFIYEMKGPEKGEGGNLRTALKTMDGARY